MGCASSRLSSSDAVRLSRDRRRHIHHAALSRHLLSSSLSSYLLSLRRAGSSLSSFSHLLPLSPSSLSPPSPSHPSQMSSYPSQITSQTPQRYPHFAKDRSFPPPSSLPPPSPSDTSQISSYPSHLSSHPSQITPQTGPRYPHFPKDPTFPPTPSVCSSAWDWEKFYPPSPPSSEFFDRLRREGEEGRERDGGGSSSGSSSEMDGEDGGSEGVAEDHGRWMGKEEEGRIVVRRRDLKEIVGVVEECFGKAAAAGEAVGKLLETGRAQPEGGFRHLGKRVYHSNSLLSNLSATLTPNQPSEIGYGLNCSALEKLLTWEKKLYGEVKEREGVKIELERKLLALQSLERRGRADEKVEKMKASIDRMQSQILVSSQAAETTSSAIIRVRDEELGPQLLRLCTETAGMWREMHQFHEAQAQVVQQVRGLVDRSPTVEPTSTLLRHATKDLESAAATWHSALFRLMQHQRDYVRALLSWLRLSPPVSSELCAFCEDWLAALDRAPDASAVAAIKSFSTVISAISSKQHEELKMKKRADTVAKELEKKTLALRAAEKKVYGGDLLAERRTEVASWRRKAEEESEQLLAAAKMTREMTLKSVQIALPGVFQAMAAFSGLFADGLERICWQCN